QGASPSFSGKPRRDGSPPPQRGIQDAALHPGRGVDTKGLSSGWAAAERQGVERPPGAPGSRSLTGGGRTSRSSNRPRPRAGGVRASEARPVAKLPGVRRQVLLRALAPSAVVREQAMSQTKTLVRIGCLLAAVVAWNLLSPVMDAGAQPVKVGQKWEYATLAYEEPIGPDYGSIATWTTGKKILGAKWEKESQPHPFSKLNKDLGG